MGELINGRTPEEIKIAIGCMVPCGKCPYRGWIPTDEGCAPHVGVDTLAYIEYLEALLAKQNEREAKRNDIQRI